MSLDIICMRWEVEVTLISQRDFDIRRIFPAEFLKEQIQLLNAISQSKAQVPVWASESSSANNSGKKGTTNSFLNSFWYASQQLGLLAMRSPHRAFCRQAFTGGFYELISITSQ